MKIGPHPIEYSDLLVDSRWLSDFLEAGKLQIVDVEQPVALCLNEVIERTCIAVVPFHCHDDGK